MKAKKCKKCGNNLTGDILICSVCGHTNKKTSKLKKFIIGFGVLALVSGIIQQTPEFKEQQRQTEIENEIARKEREEKKKQEQAEKEKADAEKNRTQFNLGETITVLEDYDITISNKRLAGKYTLFDVEIVSKKDKASLVSRFNGVTSSGVIKNDGTILSFSKDYGDPISNFFSDRFDKGRKFAGYLAFDEDVVEIEILDDYWWDEKKLIVLTP